MQLIIVESPTKARTLSRFLGTDFVVEATSGHIKDLPKSKLGIEIEDDFKPDYQVVEKRLPTIKLIQLAGKKAKYIYIATDPDREGEAIAQHVYDVLITNTKLQITNERKIKRIVFHEITKHAVEQALANPRDIDRNLVNAQIARRVLDRLVGYKLSPILWKKVRRGLSAGRVQTVCVRLIVEKEREIEAFNSDEYWEIFVNLEKVNKEEFQVQLVKIDNKKVEIKNNDQAEKIVSNLKLSDYKVFDVVKKEVTKNPYAPFTTSTMTQAAARLFGWSSKKTMSVAQSLYEEGLITYHRTDSTNIADEAIAKVRDFIKSEYGEKYLPQSPRFYKTTSKVAQEAHEAVRPTSLNSKFQISNSKFVREGEMLYGLIWKRFVACQMSESVFDETTIEVEAEGQHPEHVGGSVYLLRTSGQVMKFDGWKILYKKTLQHNSDQVENIKNGVVEEGEITLPEVSKDELLKLLKVDPIQKFTQPPARYNEASLIKTLEKLGIGRPSTYAPTINTIQVRNYVEKNEGKFTPTSVGIAVNDFLMGNFADVFDYQFTAGMEEGLDKVANGDEKWVKLIADFYNPLAKKLTDVEKNAKRVPIAAEKTGEKCPECKSLRPKGPPARWGDVVIRTGRFGKFLSCSKFPDCKYTAKFINKIGMKCPECKSLRPKGPPARWGEVIIKNTKKGRKFFGCSRYPKCKWASWRKPS